MKKNMSHITLDKVDTSYLRTLQKILLDKSLHIADLIKNNLADKKYTAKRLLNKKNKEKNNFDKIKFKSLYTAIKKDKLLYKNLKLK